MQVDTLGDARYSSPIPVSIDDRLRVPARIIRLPTDEHEGLSFEVAGPRERLFFDPASTRAAIVTCGGLCPGLNNVIRSAFLELHHIYGVKEVYGIRHGYRGLDPRNGLEPIRITSELVHDIHKQGGTILGTSRGPVDLEAAVENLIARKIQVLFTVGGDGTQRGAKELWHAAKQRGYTMSVVGIPKTIDNDVAFVSRTFGYLTAIEESCRVIDCAHTEAHSVANGISIVKLMGRLAGFIAAGATVASQDANFTLIPEVPFQLDGPKGLLATLEARIRDRAHAVIVVAEGAGQDVLGASGQDRDASGNVKLGDIGIFLRERIESFFKERKLPVVLRYFDPSYVIRSRPADSEDAILCDQFARSAVHAAMAGKTGVVVGLVHDTFVHVPIDLLSREKKRVDPKGWLWRAVIASTGQPSLHD
jgi:6-phosphofructokinase 1